MKLLSVGDHCASNDIGNCCFQGGPGSVRLRFGDRTVRAVPVFGSGGSS